MTYDVTILDPRRDVEPGYWEGWRQVAGKWANWAWPVLRAGSWNSRSPLLLAVLRRAGQPTVVGVVAASVHSAVPRARFCAGQGFPSIGYLDVAAPQSSAQPGYWFDTEDAGERAAMFRAYTRAVRRELHLGGAGLLWRQIGPEDLPLLPHRLLARPTAPIAILETPFRDRDEWLASLRLSRRGDLRRIVRRLAEDPDLAVRAGPAGEVITAVELARLARLNYDKHPTVRADRRTGTRSHGWNSALLAREDITAVAYREGAGRLIGVGIVLGHPTRPLLLSWGGEPVEHGGRKHLYFDLYCRVVDLVTAAQAECVVFGKGMGELKADLGARLHPQFAVVSRLG